MYLHFIVSLFLLRGIWGGDHVGVGQRWQVDLPWIFTWICREVHSLHCLYMNLGYFWIGHHPSLELSLVVLDARFNQITYFILFVYFFRVVGGQKMLVHSSDLIVVINCIIDRVILPHGTCGMWSCSLGGSVAGYCHWQGLQLCSRLSSCLKVCSSPLSYASPWEVAVTKGIFVCTAKASIRRWEHHNYSVS